MTPPKGFSIYEDFPESPPKHKTIIQTHTSLKDKLPLYPETSAEVKNKTSIPLASKYTAVLRSVDEIMAKKQGKKTSENATVENSTSSNIASGSSNINSTAQDQSTIQDGSNMASNTSNTTAQDQSTIQNDSKVQNQKNTITFGTDITAEKPKSTFTMTSDSGINAEKPKNTFTMTSDSGNNAEKQKSIFTSDSGINAQKQKSIFTFSTDSSAQNQKTDAHKKIDFKGKATTNTSVTDHQASNAKPDGSPANSPTGDFSGQGNLNLSRARPATSTPNPFPYPFKLDTQNPGDAGNSNSPRKDRKFSEANLKIKLDGLQKQLDEVYGTLEEKNEIITRLEAEVKQERNAAEKAKRDLKDEQMMAMVSVGEKVNELREKQEPRDNKLLEQKRLTNKEMELKQEAFALVESLQSDLEDERTKREKTQQELDELRARFDGADEMVASLQIEAKQAHEEADTHAQAFDMVEKLSEKLEPVMIKYGGAFTADNVLKHIDDLEEKASGAYRRVTSGTSMQSADGGLPLPKTRGKRNASLGDELAATGYQTDDEDDDDQAAAEAAQLRDELAAKESKIEELESRNATLHHQYEEAAAKATNGKPTSPEVITKEVVVVRNTTILEAVGNAPLWQLLLLVLMLVLWAVPTFSGLVREALWSEVNDTTSYDHILPYLTGKWDAYEGAARTMYG